MKAWVYDSKGQGWLLPTLLSWDISHGFGSPCDCFEVSFLHTQDMPEVLSRATDFKAEYEGKTVFRGRVDEFQSQASDAGCVTTLRGRGMQALLLDNEAESADYYNPDLDYILSRHVREMGINEISTSGAAGSVSQFTVESGMSHWGVVAEFADFCCGVKPRFSPEGVLVMDGEHGGNSLMLDDSTPLVSMEYREDRYGVIGSVKVKKYSGGGELTVENAEFLAKGGKCHRVINVPKKTSYDSMRYTAQYQIKRSMEDHRKCLVHLPGLFAAFPGDTVEIKSSPLGVTGAFLVVLSRCSCNDRGGFTELEMRRI